MPKRTRPHEEVLLESIQDPREAAYYLNAALEDSDEMFLEALGNVASAYKMSKVAERAGVARQAIYRMLNQGGNPTFASLMAILRALGLRFAIESDISEVPTNNVAPNSTDTVLERGQVRADRDRRSWRDATACPDRSTGPCNG